MAGVTPIFINGAKNKEALQLASSSVVKQAEMPDSVGLKFSQEFRDDATLTLVALDILKRRSKKEEETKGKWELNRTHPFVKELTDPKLPVIALQSDEDNLTIQGFLYPIARLDTKDAAADGRKFLVVNASCAIMDPLTGQCFDYATKKMVDPKALKTAGGEPQQLLLQSLLQDNLGDAILFFPHIESLVQKYVGFEAALGDVLGSIRSTERKGRLTLVFHSPDGFPDQVMHHTHVTTHLPVIKLEDRKKIITYQVGSVVIASEDEKMKINSGKHPVVARFAVRTGALPVSMTREIVRRVLVKNDYRWDERVFRLMEAYLADEVNKNGLSIQDTHNVVPLIGVQAIVDFIEKQLVEGKIRDDRSLINLIGSFGPPGTGKSEGTKFAAQKWGRPCILMSGADVRKGIVGSTGGSMKKNLAMTEAMRAILNMDDMGDLFRGLQSSAETEGGALIEAQSAIQTAIQEWSNAASPAIAWITGNTLEGLPEAIIDRSKILFYVDAPAVEDLGELFRMQISKHKKLISSVTQKSPEDALVFSEGEDAIVEAFVRFAGERMKQAKKRYVGRQADKIMEKAYGMDADGVYRVTEERLKRAIDQVRPGCDPAEWHKKFEPWADILIDSQAGVPLADVIDWQTYERKAEYER